MNPFNPSQSRTVAVTFQGVHRWLVDIEGMLDRAGLESPFSEFVPDLSPTEARVLRDYFARIRSAMLDLLRDCEIPLGVQRTSLCWAVQAHLAMAAVAVAELGPRQLEGYGALSAEGRERALRIGQELDRLVERAHAFLARRHGPALADRLARLGDAGGAGDLRLVERAVTRWGLVEFRPQLDALARRLEAPEFEVAVFGRVSSGKAARSTTPASACRTLNRSSRCRSGWSAPGCRRNARTAWSAATHGRRSSGRTTRTATCGRCTRSTATSNTGGRGSRRRWFSVTRSSRTSRWCGNTA